MGAVTKKCEIKKVLMMDQKRHPSFIGSIRKILNQLHGANSLAYFTGPERDS
jgi:hypothetical protein